MGFRPGFMGMILQSSFFHIGLGILDMACLITRRYEEYDPSIFYQEDYDTYRADRLRYHLDLERYRSGGKSDPPLIEYNGISINSIGEFHLAHWIGYS